MNISMNRKSGAIVLILASAAIAAAAVPEEIRLTPSEIDTLAKGGAGEGTSGVSGIRTTVLRGDPSKSGPYAIEIRVPANTRIQAHTHRDDRSAVVVSGTWYFGYGRKADEKLVKTLLPAVSTPSRRMRLTSH